MPSATMKADPGYVKISPEVFHKWALEFLQCKDDFRVTGRYSPVPYFLLCRAIELELKARQLQHIALSAIKRDHNLIGHYNRLQPDEKVLTDTEYKVLRASNNYYKGKGFEYFEPAQAATWELPNLAALDSIARKLMVV